MRNLNIILATILFAAFTLTSCQKEQITDLQDTTVSATNERGIPAEGIHIVNEAVQTAAPADLFTQRSTSRSRTITTIDCGTNYNGYTRGEGNSLSANNYPSCIRDLNASFNGEDQIFYLVVPSTPEAIVTYDIELTGMSQDLDLFLLALDANGYISNCKAISINAYATDEKISVTGLAPGAYAVVVDAYASGIASHFNLAVYCSAVSANPPTTGGVLIPDNAPSISIDRITTTQTTFVNILGQWYDEMEPPHFAVAFEEVATASNNIIAIERTQVEGNTETTRTLEFDLSNNQVTITEITKVSSSIGISATSSISLDRIVNVEYDGE